VLQRFVALEEEIAKFLEQEPRQFPELEDESWNHDLFFFCDVTTRLNNLKTQLLGKISLYFNFSQQ
jgi:hypothetical protein